MKEKINSCKMYYAKVKSHSIFLTWQLSDFAGSYFYEIYSFFIFYFYLFTFYCLRSGKTCFDFQ